MTTVAYFGTIMEDEVGRQLRKIGSEDPKWKETWRQNEWNSRKKKKKQMKNKYWSNSTATWAKEKKWTFRKGWLTGGIFLTDKWK